jgi:hypothetical protein
MAARPFSDRLSPFIYVTDAARAFGIELDYHDGQEPINLVPAPSK